jgi:Cdc6-like AAA superfamily ATPase
MDKVFVEEMKKRVEKELQEKEIASVQYWKEELEKIIKKRSESLGALQLDLKNLSLRMENRVKAIKKSGL